MEKLLYRLIFIISSILLFVDLWGCQSGDGINMERYRSYVELTATNESGVLQAGIEIEAGIHIEGEIIAVMRKLTDKEGKAYFGNLIPGEYAFYSKPIIPGIYPDTIWGFVEYGRNHYLDFPMKMKSIAPTTGQLVLTLMDTDQNPLKGLVVSFYDSKSILIGDFKSDIFGRIKRFNMELGMYKIIPKNEGSPMDILILAGNNEFEYIM